MAISNADLTQSRTGANDEAGLEASAPGCFEDLPIEGQALASRLAIAREDAQEFCDLGLAAEGHTVVPHGIHVLMHRLIASCERLGRHLVIVMPPEHGKTSQIAKLLVYCLGHDPTQRIGLVSADYDLGQRNLIAMRKTLLSRVTRAVFPDLRPDDGRSQARGEWNKTRLYLEGQQWPAVEVFPRDGAAEGVRLDKIWMDDVVTRECARSQAERERAKASIHGTWLSRITRGGMCIITNNCWHRADPVHEMTKSPSFTTLWVGYVGTSQIYWRIHFAPEGWTGPVEGRLPLWAPWPERRLLERQMMDRTTYKRLYMQRAVVAEDCRFPPVSEWTRWRVLPDPDKGARIFAHLDPAGGRRVDKGDFSALTLVMLSAETGLKHVIDCRVARDNPDDQVQWCFEMHDRWQRFGGIFQLTVEALAKDQAWIRTPFEQERERRRSLGMAWDLDIVFTNPRENKGSRIELLGSPLRNGWLVWPEALEARMNSFEDRSWQELVEQVEDFPFGEHDDGPDSLAAACALADRVGADMMDAPDDEDLLRARIKADRQALIENRLGRRNHDGSWKKPKQEDKWGICTWRWRRLSIKAGWRWRQCRMVTWR
ncbi:MAG: hypothetical protein ABFD89_23770 [Bryobacteraceae bacterium]